MTPPATGWTVAGLYAAALEASDNRSALLTFDAPLGIPSSYFAAFERRHGPSGKTFVDWLAVASVLPGFFDPVTVADKWNVARPFFHVPAGKGSYAAFEAAAAREGVSLKRAVDVATRANSLFALGLPGQVAPAAQALWREVVDAREQGCAFDVAPFEPEPQAPRRDVVVAENYPRAAYGAALAPTLPASPRSISKNNGSVRAASIAELEGAQWLRMHGISLSDTTYATADDGDFDACLTAAASLRLVLERRPLASSADPVSEGMMLCA